MAKGDDLSKRLNKRLDELFSSVQPDEIPDLVEQPRPSTQAVERAPASAVGAVEKPVEMARPVEDAKPIVFADAGLSMSVFDHATIGMLRTSTDGRIMKANLSFCSLLGYTPKEVEGSSLQSLTYEDDLRIGSEAMRAMLNGEQPSAQIRKRYVRKDDSLAWVELNISLLKDEAGKPEHFFTVAREITEEMQTAAQLEKRVRELNCLNDIGHRIDERPGIADFLTWVARRIPEAFQYPQDCLAAIEYDGDVFGRSEALELPSKSVGGLRVAGELVGWLHVAYLQNREFADTESALIGGIVSRVAGYIESVQEQAQAQQALDSMRIFRNGLENSTDAVFITDLSGTITYVNPGFTKIYGFSKEEAIGQNPRLIKSGILTNDTYKNFWQTLLSGQIVSGEIVNKTKDGRIIPVEGSNIPIKDDDGEIIAFLALHRDISERKETERSLAMRATQLATVAEVSANVTSLMDPQVMLQTVVNLTKESFGLYHTHVYLLDGDGETLALSAGAFEIGQVMVKQSWRIPIDREQSLVARAARERKPVIVNDVRTAPDYLPNELLPDTLSELAVPLLVGDQLLGVLDVQSEHADHFTDEDSRVMSTLASQVAVALQNTRRFEETRNSEHLVRTIMNSTPDWIFVKDRQHRFLMVNDSFAAAMGIPVEVFTGKNDIEVGFPEEMVMGNPEKGIQGYWWDDQRVMDLGKPVETRGEPNEINGQPHFFDVYKAPLFDAAGMVTGMLGFARDVTDREILLGQAESQSKTLSILNDMSRALVAVPDLDAVLQTVYVYCSRLMNTENFYIAIYDREQDLLSFPLIYLNGQKDESETHSRRLGSAGFTDYIIINQEIVWLDQNVQDRAAELGIEFLSLGDDTPSLSWLGVPMIYAGLVTGVIAVQSITTPGMYGERERDLLQGIAIQAANAIALVQQYNQAQQSLTLTTRQASNLAALNEMATEINSAENEQRVLQIAGDYLPHILDVSRASVAIMLSDHQTFSVTAIYEAEDTQLKDEPGGPTAPGGPFRMPMLGTVANLAMMDFRVVSLPDDRAWEEFMRLDPDVRTMAMSGVRTLLSVPLTVGGKAFGALNLGARLPDAYSRVDRSLIVQVANLIASALENRRLITQIEERARREQSLREIASRVRSSMVADTILQTAARELGEALGRKTFVHLEPGSNRPTLVPASQDESTTGMIGASSRIGGGDGQ